MKRILTVVIGFVHDFAAGVWAATVFAVWWIHRTPIPGPASTALSALMREFFWMGIAAIIVVLLTGAGRTFTYVDGFYGAEAEAARRRALIVKHVILIVVFGSGAFWQYRLAFY